MLGLFKDIDSSSPFDDVPMKKERHKTLGNIIPKKNRPYNQENFANIQVKTLSGNIIRFPEVINEYTFIKFIGKGCSCVVALLKLNNTNQLYAAKIFLIKENNNILFIDTEIKVLNLFSHPNIIKMHNHFKFRNDLNDEIYFIILDYHENGHLGDFLRKNPIDEALLKKIINGIISAIKHIQMLGISHNDIKPNNILIDSYQNPILADFGYASNQKYIFNIFTTYMYASPEMLRLNDYFDPLISDIWSLGVTLFVIATKVFPYDYKKPITKKILDESLLKVENIKLRKLISICLQINPINRARINTISKHEYLIDDKF